ncbi:MAG: hypothetical protein OIF58_16770 [Cohaesibacter sp.]|nr:hypothetical protein [Cohaesibacter sp.]
MVGKRVLALGCLASLFFWETLSHFSSKGTFCTSCYQDDSQNFLLLAPPLLMIWLFRRSLFVGADEAANQEAAPVPAKDK